MAGSAQLLSTFGTSLGGSASVFQTPSNPQSLVDPTSPSSAVTSIGGSTSSSTSLGTPTTNDQRIRLRCMRGQETQVYGDPSNTNNLLAVLNPQATTTSGTDGLLFPYTPSITVNQDVDYRDIGALTHTIGDVLSYNHTPSVKLSVSADFTVQNQREGRYALAALHFLRTVSKMYFGQNSSTTPNSPTGTTPPATATSATNLAGLPPPILIFTGYGNFIFNNLPVILKSHSYSFDKGMNMIPIQTAGGSASLPPMFQISMELQVQQTPTAMRTQFNLDQFRTGALMSSSNEPVWI